MISDTKGRLSVTAFFLLYPVGALPLVFIELINRRLYAVILFSLFAGFLGYITIPYYLDDLVQYFQSFETVQQVNNTAIDNFLIVQRGPVTYYLFLALASLGLSKQVIPFLALFTVVLLKLLIYRDITLRLQISHVKILFLLLIIFLLSTNFRSTVLGIRNYTAISVLLYGIYLLLILEKKWGWIYILLSPLIHAMTLLYIPLIIFAFVINNPKYLKPLLILSLAFYFIDIQYIVSSVTSYIADIGLIDPKISVHIGSYVEGYWATEYLMDLSFKGKIFSQLMLFPYFLINILMLLFAKPESRLHTLLFLSAVFCNLLFSLPNLFGRYSILPMLIFIVIYAMEHKDLVYSIKYKFITISLIFAFSIYFFAQVYNMRYIILKSYPRMLYKTSVGILNTEVTHDEYIINF